jgi:mannosyltransferase
MDDIMNVSRIGEREAPHLFARLRASSLALDIAIVSTVVLLLGLLRLGVPSLWVDESFTALRVDQPISEYFEGYYPLYSVVIKAWTVVAGTSEFALRLPSVLATILACALIVVLGRRLFDRWVALAAGLLLATSPFSVRWSQQARAYSMMVVLVLVATLLLLRALERNTRGAWAVYGIAFSTVMVWHPVAGLLLAAPHAVFAFQRRGRLLPHCLLAIGIVMTIGVTWSAQLALRSGAGSAIDWIEYPTAKVFFRSLFDVSGATGFGLALAVLGLIVLARQGSDAMSVWLGVWAFSPFVVSLVASLEQPIFVDRYLLVAAPAFSLLGGVALVRAGRVQRGLLLACLVAATAVGLAEWYSTSEGGNWRGEDWRDAAEFVSGRTDDAVVVVPWWANPAATYYGARVAATSTADSIWVLSWSEDGHELPASVRAPLGFGRHELVESHPFGWRVTAQLWRRPASP